MSASTASAVAIDAFYRRVKDCSAPPTLTDKPGAKKAHPSRSASPKPGDNTPSSRGRRGQGPQVLCGAGIFSAVTGPAHLGVKFPTRPTRERC